MNGIVIIALNLVREYFTIKREPRGKGKHGYFKKKKIDGQRREKPMKRYGLGDRSKSLLVAQISKVMLELRGDMFPQRVALTSIKSILRTMLEG
jgi:hypothetical protein